MKIKKGPIIALLAGLLFGAVSFAAADGWATSCAQYITEGITVSGEGVEKCEVYSRGNQEGPSGLFVRCHGKTGNVERQLVRGEP